MRRLRFRESYTVELNFDTMSIDTRTIGLPEISGDTVQSPISAEIMDLVVTSESDQVHVSSESLTTSRKWMNHISTVTLAKKQQIR